MGNGLNSSSNNNSSSQLQHSRNDVMAAVPAPASVLYKYARQNRITRTVWALRLRFGN